MRLRHFIIDAQKVETTSLVASSFEAESSPTGGILDETIRPKLDPPSVYQGAIQTHINASDVKFYGLCVSGSATVSNLYTGDRLKMTGSLSAKRVISDPFPVKFQVVMICEGIPEG